MLVGLTEFCISLFLLNEYIYFDKIIKNADTMKLIETGQPVLKDLVKNPCEWNSNYRSEGESLTPSTSLSCKLVRRR
jgi:hypothetical protein